MRIDASKAAKPISPFICGQSIEHLGRCICGGLWAEMLEDRKFYYAVSGDAPAWEFFTPEMTMFDGEGHPYELLQRSPWMIVGAKSSVRMVPDHADVGEHTPRITDLTQDFSSHDLEYRSDLTTDNGSIEIIRESSGDFSVGTVSLMPANNILG